ncbi:MAG TPA: cupin domain-containing protein [Sphingobacteriaceae bacterium]|nr:cupin domain-containing protein [Sphingobacteriaceae bacterium]
MINTLAKPELILLKKGACFKVLQVSGTAGMFMPPHHSTQEAVLIVKEGSATLKIDGQEHHLHKGDLFIIPATVSHSLELKTDFMAWVTMELESAIEFDKY